MAATKRDLEKPSFATSLLSGFVCASLNYRLRGDKGTVPQAYLDAISNADDITNEEAFQVLSMYPAGRDCKAAVRWLCQRFRYRVQCRSDLMIGGSAEPIPL